MCLCHVCGRGGAVGSEPRAPAASVEHVAAPAGVTDATVIVVGQAERPFTDSNGRYTLNHQQGQWRIKVGKEGFVPVVSELNIKEDTVNIPEITLWPQPTENGFYLLGDGSGSFSAATNFAVGSQARSLSVGDFNVDMLPISILDP